MITNVVPPPALPHPPTRALAAPTQFLSKNAVVHAWPVFVHCSQYEGVHSRNVVAVKGLTRDKCGTKNTNEEANSIQSTGRVHRTGESRWNRTDNEKTGHHFARAKTIN